MVGAVLVYRGRIIGEGFHQEYGEAHAEVNAITSVREENKAFIPESTLYVSLEPCCHYGKTPPCTDKILSSGIREVKISLEDPNPLVQGNGVKRLREQGVKVITGILEKEGTHLIRAFSCYVQKKRPYVILKFAQSKDGFMGVDGKQVWFSNEYANISSHKLRGIVDGILVGTKTALTDNPRLNTRLYYGPDPTRIVFDRNLRIPEDCHLWSDDQSTIFVTTGKAEGKPNMEFLQLAFDDDLLPAMLSALYERKMQKLMVEGGAETLKHFLKLDLWDEAWIYYTPVIQEQGLKAPVIQGVLLEESRLGDNRLEIIQRVSKSAENV